MWHTVGSISQIVTEEERQKKGRNGAPRLSVSSSPVVWFAALSVQSSPKNTHQWTWLAMQFGVEWSHLNFWWPWAFFLLICWRVSLFRWESACPVGFSFLFLLDGESIMCLFHSWFLQRSCYVSSQLVIKRARGGGGPQDPKQYTLIKRISPFSLYLNEDVM